MTTAVNAGSNGNDDNDKKAAAKAQAEEVKAEAAAKAEDIKNEAAETAQDVQDKAQEAAENAAEEAKGVAAKAQDAAEEAAEKASAAVQDAKDAVSEKVEEITGKAEDKLEDMRDDNSAGTPTEQQRIASGKTRQFETLKSIPDLKTTNRKIFLGALPVVGETRSATSDPKSATQVTGVTIDKDNLAAYTDATGLRLGNDVPPTYFFVLAFPMIMDLMSRPDFPVPAIGAVHISNVIEQKRTLHVDETFTIRAYGENLRPHRRGLMVDLITEVFAEGEGAGTEGEPVWRQTSSFLAMGAKFSKSADLAVTTRGEDSGKVLPKPELPEFKPNARWRWTRDNVNAYVEASNDHNPIHTSNIGAKLFGFPAVIAHGMFSAAAVLAPLEGKVPEALRYSVEFVKPVVVPTSVALWATEDGEGNYQIQLRGSSKPEKLHLNGELKAL